MSKISIIGTGVVGASVAYALMLKDIVDEIVLIDLNERLVESEIFDLKHGIASMGNLKIYSGKYEDIKDSDIILVTAGRSRKPHETRLNMAMENVNIARSIAYNIKKYYTKGIVLIVSNPVDIVTYQVSQILDLPSNLVFGTGCILDTSRLVMYIADYLGCDIKDVYGLVIGEHGDSQVVVWSKVTVCNMNIYKYCELNNVRFNEEDKLAIEQCVTQMGTKIINGKGKTNYGIATCVCYIADAIINNYSIKVSVSSCLDGEYGLSNVSLSLPSVVSGRGLEKVICEDLNNIEVSKLMTSANRLKDIIKKCEDRTVFD